MREHRRDDVNSRIPVQKGSGRRALAPMEMCRATMLLITILAMTFAPVIANPFLDAAQGNRLRFASAARSVG
jgi:hypothetical protein